MFHGMYEYRDEYGKVYHLSAKVGGFRTPEQAAKAISKRSETGYVTDHRNVCLCIVRNGSIVKF